ncbi:HDOD domain-containing protein [Thiobaca trueperi]|uniref:HD-like signal output (HDOD) protein n=1 Tax=Thiobaca trueperi TaxID=127458 RepID=A0A4R3N042_9GAMM|nr:HDOD domain-containing protein [Thiobaca trueperi]TCT21361.1 HD-like signal output (HDOD) protein [Thiobaca trueperi]
MLKFWKQGARGHESDADETQESLAQGLRDAGEAGAFPALPDPDLVRLFNTAVLAKLTAGERLFDAGDPADRLYIILAGRIDLQGTDVARSEGFGAGDWLCDVDFAAPAARDAGAVARVPTTLLIIDTPTFTSFDASLKTYLIEHMARLNLDRLRRLARRQRALTTLNGELIDALFEARTQTGFAQTPVARQLFAKVPALPVSTMALLNRILDERTTQGEIVDLVTQDPALTSLLLKAANAPAYGLQQKVTNVSQALVMLGHQVVYQIIMSESVRQSLPGTPFFADLHQRAVEVSRIAFVLSQTVNVAKPAEVATLGILSEIGFVVIELLKAYNQRLSILFDFLEPAEMGAELLRSWKLPEALCSSLEYQHYPQFAPPSRVPEDVRTNVAVLYLARRFYHALHQDGSRLPTLFARDYLVALGQSGVSERELLYNRLLPRLRAQIRVLPKSLADVLQA